jgi:hypothetical protein
MIPISFHIGQLARRREKPEDSSKQRETCRAPIQANGSFPLRLEPELDQAANSI